MGNTYLIAGGSSGIGFKLSMQLLQKGHEVIVLSRNRRDLLFGIEHHSIDFSEEQINLPVIDKPLNGIVYLPGSINLKPFKSFSSNDFIKDYRLNVLGAFETVKAYLPNLVKDGTSSVLFASTVAVGTGMPYHSMVSASKGALEGFTRSMAAELAPLIRVNALALSLTDTPLAERFLNTEEKRKASESRHPMNRVADPEDIATWMRMLLGEESKFVTGQILTLDGGMSALRK